MGRCQRGDRQQGGRVVATGCPPQALRPANSGMSLRGVVRPAIGDADSPTGAPMNRLASPAQLHASVIRWALFLVPSVVLLGFLSGQYAGSGPDNPWFAALDKPSIYPPPAAFGIVWSVLYALMGFALALVCAAWGARYRVPAIF